MKKKRKKGRMEDGKEGNKGVRKEVRIEEGRKEGE